MNIFKFGRFCFQEIKSGLPLKWWGDLYDMYKRELEFQKMDEQSIITDLDFTQETKDNIVKTFKDLEKKSRKPRKKVKNLKKRK